MIKRLILPLTLLFCAGMLSAQSFRIEDLKNQFGKGKPFKLTGGFSANSTFNAGNEVSNRDPFAYYLNGNINLNIYGLVDLPFSFSLTNSTSSYQLPSTPNRFSITPSYKWIKGYFGDVSMTFSPYTLNGHQFTGAGVELTPDGWEFAAMYGRLLKAVEYDEAQPAFPPNYKRMGYGVKVGKTADNYKISINMLNAKDIESSLFVPIDSLGITPMANLAGSLSFWYKPVKRIEITGEYGLSLLTNDRRSPKGNQSGVLSLWNGSNMSSSYYNAFKMQVNLVGDNNSLGLGYERIDPEYKTLGAYYFVNDLENITLNASQAFWQNKINLNVSVGYEHDDLKKRKANVSSRVVGSANLSAALTERINVNLSYSNFQSYTNVRSNFEVINKENSLDLLDTLNFVQLSQNANISLGIVTKKTETQEHNLNLNFSYQDAANKQGEIYQVGSVTEMMNAVASYSWTFLQSGLSLNGDINLNNSKLLNSNTITWGPTLGVSSKLFKKKVNLSGSVSYNSGLLDGIKQNEVLLGRINSSYSPYKQHNLTFAYNFQWRSAVNRPTKNNSLITLGYNYHF
ncbi:MAG: hypothetical protein LBN93_07130 [Candidatus Symbiothrix sp.]|jgi:hypothetical protein|nr:hypothetical protein [Candidatus Symbiothrix sp.]